MVANRHKALLIIFSAFSLGVLTGILAMNLLPRRPPSAAPGPAGVVEELLVRSNWMPARKRRWSRYWVRRDRSLRHSRTRHVLSSTRFARHLVRVSGPC